MALSRKEKDTASQYPPEKKKPDTVDYKYNFIKIHTDKEGEFKDMAILHSEFRDLLKSFGFIRYDIERQSIFVLQEEKVISEVTVNVIMDTFEAYIKKLPEELRIGSFKLKRKYLMDKFLRGLGQLFNDKFLSRLQPDTPVIINNDTQKESYFYFRNGFVKATPEGYDLLPYSKLEGFIWKNQILNRDFVKMEVEGKEITELSPYARFINLVSGSQERYNSLCSIIGYNLHIYTDMKCKATILTDSAISERSEGRTGKTLFGKALGKMLNCSDEKSVYCEISGKGFDPENKHKYQTCELDTQVVHLNDVKDYFPLTCLYNDITEGISIERKGDQPIKIKPKVIISTNRTIIIDGASAKDRCIEFEFVNYFSDRHSPEDEFGHWFFRDWNIEQWQAFDNFMIYCTSIYLSAGILKPKSINLEKRKLLDQTCKEFIEWLDEKFESTELYFKDKTGTPDEGYFDLKTLFTQFNTMHEDYTKDRRHTQKRFNKWMALYTKYTDGFKEYKEEIHRRRRKDGIDIIFEKSEGK